jgi:hypothetical protein
MSKYKWHSVSDRVEDLIGQLFHNCTNVAAGYSLEEIQTALVHVLAAYTTPEHLVGADGIKPSDVAVILAEILSEEMEIAEAMTAQALADMPVEGSA